ncbi:hypothetical protein ACFX15_011176 [Malus domestica]
MIPISPAAPVILLVDSPLTSVNPASDDLFFQSLNSLKLFNMCSPFALDMAAELRQITAHPRSLEPKLSNDMIPCIIGSLFK